MIKNTSFPDIYLDDADNGNPLLCSPNSEFGIYFYQTRETLFLDAELYKAFVDNCIAKFRHSRAYSNYKSYLYDLGLKNCQMLGNINSDMAKIEMHHNGLTVFDVTLLIVNHLLTTRGKISTFMVINELKQAHKDNLVPLVMLSKTMHQMAHNTEGFMVPATMTIGNWYGLLQRYPYGVTYGIAKKLYYWIKLSLEHSYDENLNNELIKIRDQIKEWSDINNGNSGIDSINRNIGIDDFYNSL